MGKLPSSPSQVRGPTQSGTVVGPRRLSGVGRGSKEDPQLEREEEVSQLQRDREKLAELRVIRKNLGAEAREEIMMLWRSSKTTSSDSRVVTSVYTPSGKMS